MKFEGEDENTVRLINARICSEEDDVMLVTNSGRAIRFRSCPKCACSIRAPPPVCAV